jgi:hypothetical protein
MDDAISRISAELAFTRRIGAQANHSRNPSNRPWGEDYGPRKQVPNMDAPRLRVVGSGGSGDSSGGVRADTVVNGAFARQWAEVNALCRGTKVLIACVGVATFIAVIRGADLFY